MSLRHPCPGATGERCGVVVSTARCPRHAAAYERQRGTPTERGYDSRHNARRRALAETLPAPCGYCGWYIVPDQQWVAAHVVDGDPDAGLMVAHPICNERAKRKGGGGP